MKICSVKGCDNKHYGRGYCGKHHERWRKYGSPHIMKRPTPAKEKPSSCVIDGCDKCVYAFGLCVAHYTRKRRHGDPLGGGTPHGTPMNWLLDHVSHVGGKCLIWPFATARGYGMVTIDGKQRVAANYLCELINGPPPTELHECAHSCGKGQHGCVNPNHLRWATRSENHSDKVLHGTMLRGEKSPKSKLTEAQALRIKRLKGRAVGADLARKYNVDPGTIYAIWKGKNWGWLE